MRQAQAPAAPPPPHRKEVKVSDTALAMARAQKERTMLTGEQIFAPAKHPPAATPKAEMAMDSGLNASTAWAGAAIASAYAEGQAFLGYPELAMLAQRPEYRVISETIATEMTRKWIKFQAKSNSGDKSERIAQLEDEFKRLNIRDAFQKCAQDDGFFGRSHLYLDFGTNRDDREEMRSSIGDGWGSVSKAKVRRGSLRAVKPVEAVWCYPTEYNSNDPLSDDWYKPQQWFAMSREVHRTRLLTFVGREVPDLLKPAYSFGGLSMSQMAKPYVDNWLRTRQSVADLIASFAVNVLMTNMAESLGDGGNELFKRVDFFNAVRDNRGAMVVDKETEDWKNVSTPLGTLDALQAQTQEHMASVSRIPLVKLTGISPSGLNASSEGEIRVFYDFIEAYQKMFFGPHLHSVIGFVMLSLWGETDPDIGFEFEPLYSLSKKEQAEVRKIEAETDQILVDLGAISPHEVRQRVASDPETPYSGLDIDDMPDVEEESPDESEMDSPKDGDKLGHLQWGKRALSSDFARDAEWQESDHPRDEDGKFSTYYHGSESDLAGEQLSLEHFGRGAFQNISHGKSVVERGYVPAIYLTSSKSHARRYGDVHEVSLNTKDAIYVNATEELEDWARQEGYSSAQEMVDEYYDGDVYAAYEADPKFNALAKTAKEHGKKVAIVDFGSLEMRDSGKVFPIGKVAVVIDPSAIKRD